MYMYAQWERLCEQEKNPENSAFSVNIAQMEEFIASDGYIHHHYWLDIHITRVEFFFNSFLEASQAG